MRILFLVIFLALQAAGQKKEKKKKFERYSRNEIDSDEKSNIQVKPGQCGVALVPHNPYTFLNLPAYRKRRETHDEDSEHMDDLIEAQKPPKRSSFNPMKGNRIVGGVQSVPHSWPWQVYIDFVRYSCGGTLVANQWVVTAVHCTFRHPSDSSLYLGLHAISQPQRAVRREIQKVIAHPEFYKPTDWNNDISIILMDRPVVYNDYIKPICLPSSDLVIPEGTPCVVSGWGRSRKGGKQSDVLQEVAVKLISEQRCKKFEGYSNQLTDSMICAGYENGGRDACSGDSGGPMACKMTLGKAPPKSKKDKKNKKKKKGLSEPESETESIWVLYGVTSWGAGCARARAPGVYVKVTKMVKWIEDVIGVTFTDQDNYQASTWGLPVGDSFKATKPPPVISTIQKNTFNCGSDFNQNTGVVASPGYPNNYPPNSNCVWNINVENELEFVRLNVTDMKFDARASGCFINDHIRIYDGEENQVGTALCKMGKNDPDRRSSKIEQNEFQSFDIDAGHGYVVTAKGGMKIILETDSTHQKKGFQANFELLQNEPSGCSMSDKINSADKGGFFMSTGFPMKYPTNTECSWFIYSGNSQAVMVQFLSFQLEDEAWNGNCDFDFVSVYQGSRIDQSNLIKTICGKPGFDKKTRIPYKHNFISATGEMFVNFVSDNTGTESGFYATYRSIPEDVPVRTGHVLYANSGGTSSRLLLKSEDDELNEADQYGLEIVLSSHDD